MQKQTRYSLGFGTLFSLIVVGFIYLYARDKAGGWVFLKWGALIYLFIIGIPFLLFLLIMALIALFLLLFFISAKFKLRKYAKEQKKSEDMLKQVDAEYEVEDEKKKKK